MVMCLYLTSFGYLMHAAELKAETGSVYTSKVKSVTSTITILVNRDVRFAQRHLGRHFRFRFG